MYDRCVPPKRSMKRLPWWRRRIHETKLGVLGTRAGGTFFVLLIIEIVSTPWLLLALLALAAVGISRPASAAAPSSADTLLSQVLDGKSSSAAVAVTSAVNQSILDTLI